MGKKKDKQTQRDAQAQKLPSAAARQDAGPARHRR